MSSEYDVADVNQIPEGSHIVVEVGGREIGIFNVRGELHALPNVCVHQNGPLCRGVVSGTLSSSAETGWKLAWAHDGEIVVCPWHSLEYHIPTGRCLAYPKRRLPTYPVRVDMARVKVTL